MTKPLSPVSALRAKLGVVCAMLARGASHDAIAAATGYTPAMVRALIAAPGTIAAVNVARDAAKEPAALGGLRPARRAPRP